MLASTAAAVRPRFMSYIEPPPYGNACWLWTGALQSERYGCLAVREGGRRMSIRAHRIAWELFRGPIPAGLNVLHACDQPRCANPEHLFLGTQADNIRDCVMKGRNRGRPPKTHCSKGHELTSANTPPRPGAGRRCITCERMWRAANRRKHNA